MNFYHFRPSCKVIKRSRSCRGPFFTFFDDDNLREILTHPESNLKDGQVLLQNFGVYHRFSRKVFVGGLPADITEENVIDVFSKYGLLDVDWPYKEDTNANVPPKGFAFLLFRNNSAVDSLISNCEIRNGEYYLRLSTQNTTSRTVQIRPWQLSGMDHVFVQDISELHARFTVFVGGVPRTLSAEQLGIIMTRLFGNVTYVGIDTDPIYLYPKGAARVSFESRNSVVKAVKKRFLMPRETKTRKMIEIKPYILDDQTCDKCINDNNNKCTILFCPEPECLLYLCEFCWPMAHNQLSLKNHKPLIKQGLDDYMNSLKRRGLE